MTTFNSSLSTKELFEGDLNLWIRYNCGVLLWRCCRVLLLSVLGEKLKSWALAWRNIFLSFLSGDLDHKGKAVEYIKASEELLERAREEFRKDNVRQAAEKVWGATALAVKAYAYWREGRRLASHSEMWEYVEVLVGDVGEWVRDAWYAGNAMHTCFYEGWCKPGQVEAAMKRVEKLLKEIKARMNL